MPDTQTASVYATIFINFIYGSINLLLFEYFRKCKTIFAPKMYWRNAHNSHNNYNNNGLIDIADGFFAWIPQLLSIHDDEIIHLSGMDAYVLIRFLRVIVCSGGVCSFFALIILIPVYFSSPSTNAVGINLYSMAHIDAGGNRLWASVVFTYLFSFVFMYFMHYEYENFAEKRKHYFKVGDPRIPLQMLYSIQVENVPPDYRTNAKLKSLFATLFPGEVYSAGIIINASELQDAIDQRNQALKRLEQATAQLEGSPEKMRPRLLLLNGEPALLPSWCYCCYGNESKEFVDAIGYWDRKLRSNIRMVTNLQDQAIRCACGDEDHFLRKREQDNHKWIVSLGNSKASKKNASKKTSGHDGDSGKDHTLINDDDANSDKLYFGRSRVSKTGIVTFKSRRIQSVACQMPIINGRFPYMKVMPAPAPNDIIWENMVTDVFDIIKVRTLTFVALTTGFLFWGVVLAFVAAVSSLSNLEKYIPGLSSLSTGTKAILSGQLPVLALMLFISFLPTIIEFIVKKIEKRKTNSEVQDHVFKWFFKYQVANVFLILITGSLFNAIAAIIKNPASLFIILGTALPEVSVFFMNFLITQLLSGVPSMLFRYQPYAIFWLYRLIFKESALTRRTLVDGPLAKETINYGCELPSILYLLFIVFIYWVIAPIILVVGTLSFATLYLGWKYYFVFVVVPDFEGGGRFWYGLYRYSMVGLMASSITMIGYMGIKAGAAQSPLLFPLPVIIYLVWSYTEREFECLSKNLPYSDAAEKDAPIMVPRELHQISKKSRLARKQSSTRFLGASSEDSDRTPPRHRTSKDLFMMAQGLAEVEMTNIPLSSRSISSDDGIPTPRLPLPNSTHLEEHGLVHTSTLHPSADNHAVAPTTSVKSTDMSTSARPHEEPSSPDLVPEYPHHFFSRRYCVQSSVAAPNPIQPYPYRVNSIPLLTNGVMHPIYYHDDPVAALASSTKAPTETKHQSERESHGGHGSHRPLPDVDGSYEALFSFDTAFPEAPAASTEEIVSGQVEIEMIPVLAAAQQRRRSTFKEIQAAAATSEFSDEEEDENGVQSDHSQESEDYAALHHGPRVSLVSIDVFRRKVPFTSVELPRPHHRKRKGAAKKRSNTTEANDDELPTEISYLGSNVHRRGSTVAEIEKLVGSRGYFSLSADELDQPASPVPAAISGHVSSSAPSTRLEIAAAIDAPLQDDPSTGSEYANQNHKVSQESVDHSNLQIEVTAEPTKQAAQRRRSTLGEVEAVAQQHDFFQDDDGVDDESVCSVTPRGSFYSPNDGLTAPFSPNPVSLVPTSSSSRRLRASRDENEEAAADSESSVSQDASTTTDENEGERDEPEARPSVFRRASLALFGR